MRLSYEEMAFELGKLAYSKRTWLQDHAKRFPAHEAERVQKELAVLEQAQSDYSRAAERQKEKVA
jgi:hypothetical protein